MRKEKADLVPQENSMKFSKIILAILLVPIVIATAIAMMMLSYMLVPVMIVTLVGTVIYIILKGNSKE